MINDPKGEQCESYFNEAEQNKNKKVINGTKHFNESELNLFIMNTITDYHLSKNYFDSYFLY